MLETISTLLSILRKPRLTWAEVLAEYLASPKFLHLASASQKPYRRVLVRWVAQEGIGSRAAASLTKRELEAMLARQSRGAANFLLKRVRVLVRFGVARGYLPTDISQGIECKPPGREHHTWTDDEIDQYRERWALGTRQRLAFELALNTSQRRTDLARLRYEDINRGRISVRQSKTGTTLVLPVHPDLQAALAAMRGPRTGPIIAHAGSRKPRGLTPESLGNLMAEWIEGAGLPSRCVLHGLRKACCRRLAELGCSEKEIASVSGHLTLTEVARYTKAASQERLAGQALGRVVGAAS